MKVKKKDEQEANFTKTPLLEFVEYYNQNIPENFPRASLKGLEKFRESYPALFRGQKDEWTIDKHRKKLMDWLASHKDE